MNTSNTSGLTLGAGSQTIEKDQLIFNGSTYYTFAPDEQLITQYSVALQYTQTENTPLSGNQLIITNVFDGVISFMFGYFNTIEGKEPGYYAGNYNGGFNVVGPIPIPFSASTHIVITFTDSTLKVYLNGILTNTGDSIPPTNNDNRQYYLGRQWYAEGDLIIAKVKYVSMYNRILTSSEISYLHTGTLPTPPICFLEDAPVLTPFGYKPISSLKKGDHILTPEGLSVPIEQVKIRNTIPHSSVNPLVIPKGMYGATEALPISPEHKVLVDGRMVEAKHLGLSRMMMLMPFDYYNLELPDYEQMVVAGVTVESLYPIMRISISGDEFKKLIHNKYGSAVTEEQLAVIHKKVRYLADGRIEIPVDKRLHLKEQTVINS
jgi:hypothetical protein